MKTTQIRQGRWYLTTLGVGQCVSVDRTSVGVRVVAPIPFGLRYVAARDVLQETEPPTPDAAQRQASGRGAPPGRRA